MLAPLALLLALWHPISTDLIFYATILHSFSQQLWSGELYPRWLNVNGGLGSPVFLFYSPLAYYAGSVWQWLAPLDPHGFFRVVATMWLALVAAGTGCYGWLRGLLGEKQAQAGALIYAGFPYLLILIYFSFGLSQLWAIALFPPLLHMAGWLAERRLSGFFGLALGYGLLCLAHLPSFMVFAAVPPVYVAAMATGGIAARARLLGAAFLALLLGLALASLYWLPAMLNKPFIISDGFTGGKFHYAQNFTQMMPVIAFSIIFLPLLGLFMELPRGRRRAFLTRPVTFWLWVMAGLLFMVSPLSMPLWERLPPLQYLQFPFRFFVGMLPGVAYIAAGWLEQVKARRIYLYLGIFTMVLVVTGSMHHVFRARAEAVLVNLSHGVLTQPEYHTRWMQQAGIINTQDMLNLMPLPSVRVEQGRAGVAGLSSGNRSLMFEANVESAHARLVFRRFYFPGWQSNVGEIQEHGGLLALALPQGDHKVILSLPYYAGEREGMIISALALALWAGGLIFSLSRRPRGFISKA